jgi:hypothetical protein
MGKDSRPAEIKAGESMGNDGAVVNGVGVSRWKRGTGDFAGTASDY